MTINEMIDKWKKCAVDGWCSEEKAKRFIQIILFSRTKIAVEIGVYAGHSYIPMALAMREVGGTSYAIDPWSRKDALEGMKSPDGLHWWGNLNYDGICKDFKRKVDSLNLGDSSMIVRDRADNIVDSFSPSSVGLLHIDGNHSADNAMSDAVLYLDKVATGGFIVVNDAEWTESGAKTIRPAIEYLVNNGCALIEGTEGWVLLEKK